MAGLKQNRPSWVRFSGVGIEFAAAVGGFAAVGYWVDLHYKCEPWGVVIGAILGLIGGTYNLVRESMGAFRQQKPPDPPDNGSQQHKP